jgi:hypothetical protein
MVLVTKISKACIIPTGGILFVDNSKVFPDRPASESYFMRQEPAVRHVCVSSEPPYFEFGD